MQQNSTLLDTHQHNAVSCRSSKAVGSPTDKVHAIDHNVHSQQQELTRAKCAIAQERVKVKRKICVYNKINAPPFSHTGLIQRLQKRWQWAICESHCTSLNLLKQRLQRSGRTWGSNRSFTPISDRSMTLQRFNFLAQTSLIVSEQLSAQIPDQLSLCAPMPRCLVMDTLPVLGSAKLFWGKMAMNSKGRS